MGLGGLGVVEGQRAGVEGCATFSREGGREEGIGGAVGGDDRGWRLGHRLCLPVYCTTAKQM